MTRIHFHRLFAATSFGLLAFCSTASASDCTSSFYSQYESCKSNSVFCSPYSSPDDFVAAHPACFPGGTAASQVTVSSSSFQQIGSISSVVSSRMAASGGPLQLVSAPVKSMAAGGKNAWNVWANASASDTRQTFTVGPNTVRNDLDVTNAVFGIDYAAAPGMILGISGAFDRGQGSSQPTLLAARQLSTVTGYAIAPYLGYQINKELALDASLGFGVGKFSGAGRMESEATRFFYAVNLSYSRWIKDLQLSGKLGFLRGEEDTDDIKANSVTIAGSGAKTRINRLQLGIQAGYWLGNGMQPYAGLSYLGDSRSSTQGGVDPIGKGAWQWALGLNFFSLASGVTGGVAYTQEASRTNQRSNALAANLGFRF